MGYWVLGSAFDSHWSWLADAEDGNKGFASYYYCLDACLAYLPFQRQCLRFYDDSSGKLVVSYTFVLYRETCMSSLMH